jgi:hypothetical protein
VNTIPAVMMTEAMSFAACRRKKPLDSKELSGIFDVAAEAWTEESMRV